MKFNVYVFNIPHNAWTYTRGYLKAFQQMGLLNIGGDIHLWHDPANYPALFNNEAEYVVLIGPEHHRCNIFGSPQMRDAILVNKKRTGKKLIAICYESSVDPFGAQAWAKAGYPWLRDNYHKYGSRSSQCYSVDGLAEQFKCFDYVFTQDEVDVQWFRNQGINAHWLPACVDAEMFRPLIDKPANKAGFVGNVWWPREELVQNYPFKFDFLTVPKAPYDLPAAEQTTTDLVRAFGSYMVAVNMRSPFAGVSMRTFELMACAVMPIIYEPAPDRMQNKEIFAGWNHVHRFLEWSSQDAQKIRDNVNHLITHYEQTRERGQENRRLVLEKHTPRHRIEQIISVLSGKA